jgi:hypothetical protein
MQSPVGSVRHILPAWIAISAAAAAFVVGGVGGYSMYERRMAQNALAQQQQMAAALDQAHAQIADLSAKVNALAARPEPQPAPQPAVEMPVAPAARPAVQSHRPTQDQRIKKLQSQLDRQGKAIDEQGRAITDTRSQLENTRGDLSDTRTELTGSIARTHDELVLLQKKGERNYYEFDIDKSKQFLHEGPLGVRLRKANTKHRYADLDLLVDDQNLSQKHVNLYQPALFYAPGNTIPVELVINDISKDHIHGYVSSAKYRQSELAAVSSTGGTNASSPDSKSASQPAQRQSLPQPQ